MGNTFCNIPDCDNQDFSFWLYEGRRYCRNHYDSKFLSEFNAHFKAWDGITEPPDRMKYLIGRYYDEHETAYIGKPSLTKDIVHRRSYNWVKDNDNAIFTVIRYPVNREYGEPYFDELHQTWNFSVTTMKFTFLSEEKK